jgi:hypothetical protein
VRTLTILRTVAVTIPGNDMTVGAIENEQRYAARIAGFLYLFLMICGVVGEFYARGNLIVDGDPAKTASHIIASQHLFRFGIVSDLTAFAGDIAIALALYVVLKPVGRYLALLAAFWRVAEAAVLGAITLNSVTMLLLVTDTRYASAFSPTQVQNLMWLFNDTHDAGYTIGMMFLALGCIVFSYLFFKSRYIPRLLAAFGLLAYVVMLLACVLSIIFPDAPIGLAYYAPAGIYEISIGLWLLILGIKTPAR